jgi:hypothetical protein
LVDRKIHRTDASLAEIEQTQKELRTSIEASKAFAEMSEQLIARHRRQVDGEAAVPTPSVPPS